MMSETLFRWSSGLEHIAPDPEEILLAADSWLVSEGRVRGFDLHWGRFSDACKGISTIGQGEIDVFRRHVTRALPREGNWFPRIELVERQGAVALQFRLRAAPPLTKAVRLMHWPGKDERILPRRKGPDLALLGSMRQQTVAQGADEALLTTSDGIVLEGLTTSVAWWEGNSLCVPDPALAVLPGVTSRLLLRLAYALRMPIQYRRTHINELSGRTVWTMNALHGIRPVVQWVGSTNRAGDEVDHRPWQARLLDLGMPLDAYSETTAEDSAAQQ